MKKRFLALILTMAFLLLMAGCGNESVQGEFEFKQPLVKSAEQATFFNAYIFQSQEYSDVRVLAADQTNILYAFADKTGDTQYLAMFDYKNIDGDSNVENFNKPLEQIKLLENEQIIKGAISGDKIAILTCDMSQEMNFFIYTLNANSANRTKIEVFKYNDYYANEYAQIFCINGEIYYLSNVNGNAVITNAFTMEAVLDLEQAQLLEGALRVDGEYLSLYILEDDVPYVVVYKDFKKVSQIKIDINKELINGFCVLGDEVVLSLDEAVANQQMVNPIFKLSKTGLHETKVNYKDINYSQVTFRAGLQYVTNNKNIIFDGTYIIKFGKKENIYERINFLPNGNDVKVFYIGESTSDGVTTDKFLVSVENRSKNSDSVAYILEF